MPILTISSWVIRAIVSMDSQLNGFGPRLISRPMKKLRVTLMRGLSARSWYTVPMPAWLASRGELNSTSLPSIMILPEVGLCTPERILIKVDLPAPLSPSSAWTSPR